MFLKFLYTFETFFMLLKYAAVSLEMVELEWDCCPEVSSSRKVPHISNFLVFEMFFRMVFPKFL